MDPKKAIVVDTSLLLHSPDAIPSFKDNVVVIPFPVLQELDHHKEKGGNGTAAAARQVIRLLDDYRQRGSLLEGVPTLGGGFLLVDMHPFIPSGVSAHLLDMTKPDDFIIGVALRWKHRRTIASDARAQNGKKGQGQKGRPFFPHLGPLDETILVTKDINLRIKAAAFNLVAEDYKKDRLVTTPDQLYSGIARIPVDAAGFKEVAGKLFGEQGGAHRLSLTDAAELMDIPELLPNQCCIFEPGESRERKYILALYKADPAKGAYFSPVKKPSEERGNEIKPRNIEQAFAYALLMDPAIEIVSLSGIAGGGKTLMALLAGLNQTAPKTGKGVYEQILVYRANSEIGTPLGYLKGSLVDKWGPWAQPILDSLELLSMGKELERFETKPTMDSKTKSYNLEEMIDGKNKKIQIQPINFVRGRSLHYKFVVVDETQNFTAPDIKKVITRIGKGSKIVLTGDIDQIDNLYLDQVSNGLSHATECMKGQPIFGHITFTRSERSPLAEIAAKLL